MTIFLFDRHLEGQAALVIGTLAADGWLNLLPAHLLTFADVGLAPNSSDRAIWRFVQTSRMLLITGNRNMGGKGFTRTDAP